MNATQRQAQHRRTLARSLARLETQRQHAQAQTRKAALHREYVQEMRTQGKGEL